MSKLWADITYSHRLQTKVSLSTAQTIISEVEFLKQNKITQEKTPINIDDDEIIQKNITNSLDNQTVEEKLNEKELDEEELDEETDNLENDFGNFLQGWADILEEEKEGFNNEEFEEINENDIFLELQNITYPAIDTNTK